MKNLITLLMLTTLMSLPSFAQNECLQIVVPNTNFTGNFEDPHVITPDIDPYAMSWDVAFVQHCFADDTAAYGTTNHLTREQMYSSKLAFNHYWDSLGIKIKLVKPLRDKYNYPYVGDSINYWSTDSLPDLTFNSNNPHTIQFTKEESPSSLCLNSYAVPRNEGGWLGVSWIGLGEGPIWSIFAQDISLSYYYGHPKFFDSSTGWLHPTTRVVSHEIGHELTLFHIFASIPNAETDCDTQGDYVCDTQPVPSGSDCSENPPPYNGNQTYTTHRNEMGYNHLCKQGFSEGQGAKIFNHGENQHETLYRSYMALPVDSCDAGKPYALSVGGTFTGSNSSGVLLDFKNNGYAVGKLTDSGLTWKATCQLRGRKQGVTGIWYYPLPHFVAQLGTSANVPVLVTNSVLQDGETYEWQARCTCADQDDDIPQLINEATPWSKKATFTFNDPSLPVINNPVGTIVEWYNMENSKAESQMADGLYNVNGQKISTFEDVMIGQIYLKVENGEVTTERRTQ